MILAFDLVYNGTMAVVDGVVLILTRKPTSVSRCWFPIACVSIAALILAFLSAGMFLAMRLFSYGLFIHIPLALGIGGWRSGRGLAIGRAGRWTRGVCWCSAVALIAVGIDAFWIEPRALETTVMTVVTDKLDRPLRLVLIADLQTDHVSRYERRVLEQAVALDPDMILFAGDYLQVADGRQWEVEREKLQQIFNEVPLQAPRGIFAVGGNVDAPNWPELFESSNVETFVRTRSVVADDVQITGLSVDDSFHTQLTIPEVERFHIVLGHSPDFALGNVQADLMLCGHVHGGQVRLPGWGPLLTMSSIPRAWAVGRTELPGNRTLVVSRGVGMERGSAPRLRFLCRPEIIQIDIRPAGELSLPTGS